MNKSQKSSTNSKPKVGEQYSIEKRLKKLTYIQIFFRKIWRKILFFFALDEDEQVTHRYLFNPEPHDIYYYIRQIIKYKNYCIDILKKSLKIIRRFIIIELIALIFILIDWRELFISREISWNELLTLLFTVNNFMIFLIIGGIIWWLVTPGIHILADFLLRAKGIILRLLLLVIIISGLYFAISYPPFWFTKLSITYDESASFFSNQTWFFVPKRISSLHEPLNIRNILIGIFGLISLIFLWWRNTIADDNLKLEKKRRLDERFHEATQTLSRNLNSKTYPSHIGGISTLTQLALDSKEQTQRCLDVICSCNEWMKPFADEFKYDRTQKCYSERELYINVNSTANKSKNNKNLRDDLNKKVKWRNSVSLEEEKRSQKALNAVALILQKIANHELKEDNNFIKLSELNFRSAMLCGINLRRLELVGINLREANLNGADLQDANFNNAQLQDVKLSWANLSKINLEEANLTGIQLRKSMLYKTNLLRANMSEAELQGTNLLHSSLSGANMSNSNLQFANLRNSSLYGVNLDNAQLQGTNLRYTKLVGASLYKTHLEGANMRGANLQAALFCETFLNGTDLSDADISYSIIWKTNLYGANLKKSLRKSYIVINEKFREFKGARNEYLNQLIFSDIKLNRYEIKADEKKRIRDIGKGAPSTEQKREFMVKMNEAWKLIKNENKPKELDELKRYSVIKKKGKDGFVIKDNKLVKKLQEQWSELAKLHDVVAESLLLRQKIYFFDEEGHRPSIMNNLVSQYSETLYKKLKKSTRLKILFKEIRNDIRRRRLVGY